ncbi:uncharacterized protein AMSG_05350 [Thecamonas trahens ATCC 50062]|uniref:DEP domain-containing protein n=1 Tax=Thecamonas trahens ATCC 50062 TaxID=461836 RepID=A0A0L0DB63_THETB|nr:hypothetical protein AMSG_05350 [Thecamonas trahens ATCC 50062]KNC49351.1 hypothetical protein AMSG_05350 [Thecamonas trahens ATCC 50062]|eukprot:XP_013757777.1 hypothetical protein AMSG_05350 [Thecamonas trahens ATCC 50062]
MALDSPDATICPPYKRVRKYSPAGPGGADVVPASEAASPDGCRPLKDSLTASRSSLLSNEKPEYMESSTLATAKAVMQQNEQLDSSIRSLGGLNVEPSTTFLEVMVDREVSGQVASSITCTDNDDEVLFKLRGDRNAEDVPNTMHKRRRPTTRTRGFQRGIRGMVIGLVDASSKSNTAFQAAFRFFPALAIVIEFIQLVGLAVLVSRLRLPSPASTSLALLSLNMFVDHQQEISYSLLIVYGALNGCVLLGSGVMFGYMYTGAPAPPATLVSSVSNLCRVMSTILYVPSIHALLNPLLCQAMTHDKCLEDVGPLHALGAFAALVVHLLFATLMVANTYSADPESRDYARRAHTWLDLVALVVKTMIVFDAVSSSPLGKQASLYFMLTSVAFLAVMAIALQPYHWMAMNRVRVGFFSAVSFFLASLVMYSSYAAPEEAGTVASAVILLALPVGFGLGFVGMRPSFKSMLVSYHVSWMLSPLELGYVAADVYRYHLERLIASPQRMGLYGTYLVETLKEYDEADELFEAALATGVPGSHVIDTSVWHARLGAESTVATAHMELALRSAAERRLVVMTICTSTKLASEHATRMTFLHLRRLLREHADVAVLSARVHAAEMESHLLLHPNFPLTIQQLLRSWLGGERLSQLGHDSQYVVAKLHQFARDHRSMPDASVELLADVIRGPTSISRHSPLGAALTRPTEWRQLGEERVAEAAATSPAIMTPLATEVAGMVDIWEDDRTPGGGSTFSSTLRRRSGTWQTSRERLGTVPESEVPSPSPSSGASSSSSRLWRSGSTDGDDSLSSVLSKALCDFLQAMTWAGRSVSVAVLMVEHYNEVDPASHVVLRKLVKLAAALPVIVVTEAESGVGGCVLDDLAQSWSLVIGSRATPVSTLCRKYEFSNSLPQVAQVENIEVIRLKVNDASTTAAFAGIPFQVSLGSSAVPVCTICCTGMLVRPSEWQIMGAEPSVWHESDGGHSVASSTRLLEDMGYTHDAQVAHSRSTGIRSMLSSDSGESDDGDNSFGTLDIIAEAPPRPDGVATVDTDVAESPGEPTSTKRLQMSLSQKRRRLSWKDQAASRRHGRRASRRIAPELSTIRSEASLGFDSSMVSSVSLVSQIAPGTESVQQLLRHRSLHHIPGDYCVSTLRQVVVSVVECKVDDLGHGHKIDAVMCLLELAAVVGRSQYVTVLELAYERMQAEPVMLADAAACARVYAIESVCFGDAFGLAIEVGIVVVAGVDASARFSFCHASEHNALLATLVPDAYQHFAYQVGHALDESTHVLHSHPLAYMPYAVRAWDVQLLIKAHFELIRHEGTRTLDATRELLFLINRNDTAAGDTPLPAEMAQRREWLLASDAATHEIERGAGSAEVPRILTPHLDHKLASMPAKYSPSVSSFPERYFLESVDVHVSFEDRREALRAYMTELLRDPSDTLFDASHESEQVDDMLVILEQYITDPESQIAVDALRAKVELVRGDIRAARDAVVSGARHARKHKLARSATPAIQELLDVGGWILWSIADYAHARTWHKRAFQVAHMLQNPVQESYALAGLGFAERDLGRMRVAGSRLQQARRLAQWLGNAPWTAHIENALMGVHLGRGETEMAAELCHEVFAHCRIPSAVDKALVTLMEIAVLRHDDKAFDIAFATVLSETKSRATIADALMLVAVFEMQRVLLMRGPAMEATTSTPALYGYGSLELAVVRSRAISSRIQAVATTSNPHAGVRACSQVRQAALIAATLVAADVLARGQELADGVTETTPSPGVGGLIHGFAALQVHRLADVGRQDVDDTRDSNTLMQGRWDVLAYLHIIPRLRTDLVRTRRWWFRKYQGVFVASELVSWFVDSGFAASRSTAVIHAKHMFAFGLISHVYRAHQFQDEWKFFRFHV